MFRCKLHNSFTLSRNSRVTIHGTHVKNNNVTCNSTTHATTLYDWLRRCFTFCSLRLNFILTFIRIKFFFSCEHFLFLYTQNLEMNIFDAKLKIEFSYPICAWKQLFIKFLHNIRSSCSILGTKVSLLSRITLNNFIESEYSKITSESEVCLPETTFCFLVKSTKPKNDKLVENALNDWTLRIIKAKRLSVMTRSTWKSAPQYSIIW